MSVATLFPIAILDTILGRLALLFLSGANNDLTAARHAADRMLAAYHPETEHELRLATEIISFSFHAQEALAQATAPDLPLTKILRLRACAVSLSKAAHRAQDKLDQLQRDRPVGARPHPAEIPKAPPEQTPARPQIDQALALIEATRQAMQTAGKTDGKTWSQAYQQRQTAKRIAENLKKNQAIHAASSAPAAPVAHSTQPTVTT
jgi:hypothetical protein